MDDWLVRQVIVLGLPFQNWMIVDCYAYQHSGKELALRDQAKPKQIRALTAGALLLLTLSLGGYATSTAGSSLMDARADEASASRKKSDYPSPGVLPPPRKIMSADEWLKLKKELTAARRAAAVKAKGHAPQAVQPAQ